MNLEDIAPSSLVTETCVKSRHHGFTNTLHISWWYPVDGYAGERTKLVPAKTRDGRFIVRVTRASGYVLHFFEITEAKYGEILAETSAPPVAFRPRTRVAFRPRTRQKQ